MMAPMAELTLTDVPPGHGCISKLTSDDGDFRFTWNPDDDDDVANARQAFDDLRRQGYALYKTENGERTVIRRFDPAAGAMRVVAVRPNRGG